MQSSDRLKQIQHLLWEHLSHPITGIEVQQLQEEANALVLQQVGKSWEDLGNCAINGTPLTYDTVARDELGLLLQFNDKLWSKEAVDAHANIDWDEIAEKRLGQ